MLLSLLKPKVFALQYNEEQRFYPLSESSRHSCENQTPLFPNFLPLKTPLITTTLVVQSLVMVYAQLMHSSLEAVLGFLSSVPGPTGQSALHFVMSEWVARQPLFYGAYESKAGVYSKNNLLFIAYFMYRRHILCTLCGAVDF